MIMSGSASSMNLLHSISKSLSSLNSSTCDPTICAQVLSVKTFLMKGLFSPCLVTIDAIWMTGSICASGKMPLRPAHSISKLKTRNGAMGSHSPSGAWDTRSV